MLRPLAFTFYAYAKQQVLFPGVALAHATSWLLRSGLTVLFFSEIYRLQGLQQLHGLAFPVVASSTLIYTLFTIMGMRALPMTFDRQYASGAMAMWLNKPLPYLLFRSVSGLAENVVSFMSILLFIMIFWSLGGFPETAEPLARLAAGGLLFLLGLVLALILYTLIGLSAFWFGESAGVYQIVDKFIMLFGGCYVPVAFFPSLLRQVGEASPMGAMMACTQTFYPDLWDNLPRFLGIQVFWIVVLGAALWRAQAFAQKRLVVQGG